MRAISAPVPARSASAITLAHAALRAAHHIRAAIEFSLHCGHRLSELPIETVGIGFDPGGKLGIGFDAQRRLQMRGSLSPSPGLPCLSMERSTTARNSASWPALTIGTPCSSIVIGFMVVAAQHEIDARNPAGSTSCRPPPVHGSRLRPRRPHGCAMPSPLRQPPRWATGK